MYRPARFAAVPCWYLAGALWLCCAGAMAAVAPLSVKEIAAGVFVHAGVQEDASPANQGDIANIGFVVGEKCVAVIDSGGSSQVGAALRAAIKTVTATPICYVINTHAHPDHVFGNAAFLADKPQFVGGAKLPKALGARAASFLKQLERDLGKEAAGSEIIVAELLVEDAMELDLGGRVIELRAWPTAHTDHDLTVFDRKTASLWLGDLLFVERIPVVDGSVVGWLKVMKSLRGIEARHIIPGHGGVGAPWPQAMSPQERYLTTLAAEVRAAIKERLRLQQAVDTVGLSEKKQWLLFDDYHRRNVTSAFAELEWED